MNKKLNANLVKVVNILSDGKYHDGTTMGEALNMTRSAVWKAIKKLESYGVKIDSIKSKGYALQEPLTLLDEQFIKSRIARDLDVCVFESVDSTNEYLKTSKHCAIKICVAEQQAHGKGRMGRDWVSPFGKNIYLSCHYPFQKDISELSGLSLVVSLATIKTLKSIGVSENVSIKWPNDIIYDKQKLSGSLIEIQAETHGMCHAIIGIGLNVNMLQDDNRITQPWASLTQILNKYVDRNDLCVRLINQLFADLECFKCEGFEPFMKEWGDVDYLKDKTIEIKHVNETINGVMAGINQQGHLLLRLADGETRVFSSGDTSIVKKPV